jgi:hypothetical protein
VAAEEQKSKKRKGEKAKQIEADVKQPIQQERAKSPEPVITTKLSKAQKKQKRNLLQQ